MRAAVTQGRGTIRVLDVPGPGQPGPGEVIVRPEAVGLCGSDFHYFLGDIGAVPDSQRYPRIQGHEAAGVVEVVGPDCPPHLRTGERVAIWPLISCGNCYPCSIGRGNVCVNISLVGIHRDGALQQRLVLPASQVFPVGDQDPAVAALIEPVSIAVRAVVRSRIEAGEKAVVFGAGPIGQSLAAAAIDRGASVLLVDPLPSRVERGRVLGAEFLAPDPGDDPVAAALEWAGGDGPEVVFEATGVPEVTRTAVELVAQAGRVVVIGLSSHDAPLRVGDLAFKEIDVLGVSCCNADEFAEAVSLVARREDALAGLVTHEFTLEETPEAIAYAMRHPAEVMKAVIRLEQG
ncbi:MAG: zinc-dependent alcohol dehydrogenase [Gaiellaceae bacterium]